MLVLHHAGEPRGRDLGFVCAARTCCAENPSTTLVSRAGVISGSSARHARAALKMQLNKTDQNNALGLVQIM
jgi:hypothetical protein